MVTPSQTRQVSDEIACRFRPERIILFGTYASGTPTEDAGVEVLACTRRSDDNQR
jgi:predicted nucleotidyltransferase